MRFTGGTKLGSALNRLEQDSRRGRAMSSAGELTSQGTDGFTRTLLWSPSLLRNGKIKRFTITAIQNDYLECKPTNADGTANMDAATVNVAKPLPLRGSTFDGVTIDGWPYSVIDSNRRRAIQTGATAEFSAGAIIEETIDPPYGIGQSDIYAVKVATDVPGADWIDLNVNARHWMPGKTEVRVCVLVDGVQTQKKMVVRGGPVYA